MCRIGFLHAKSCLFACKVRPLSYRSPFACCATTVVMCLHTACYCKKVQLQIRVLPLHLSLRLSECTCSVEMQNYKGKATLSPPHFIAILDIGCLQHCAVTNSRTVNDKPVNYNVFVDLFWTLNRITFNIH